MTIHEFGKKEKPVLLLLPGTMCHWKGNFDGDFLVSCVAYTGFDEGDKEDYRSVMDESQRIEEEVQRRYDMCSMRKRFVLGRRSKNE